ncbi:1824_t:CDS:2 [Racocetra fulgida]|uniref:1824_t:CDS:1 n=1 Tax=Racocetra fulgida TaxID=60492 RepID=A0A9N8W111_9GLOM|nr:1824_t:CDS:2 [Racocetra fulgida]
MPSTIDIVPGSVGTMSAEILENICIIGNLHRQSMINDRPKKT